jgi:uncharacterized membrane protein YebE (DUF533 family)
MTKENKTKQLFKLLIGAAWLDGVIDTKEREYLHKMVRENALADDPEIKILLSEVQPIPSEQCYQWLEEYLGENHSADDYQQLLESLSALVYVDNDIAIEEAQFLTYLETLESDQSVFHQILRNIQQMYLKAVASLE